MGKLSDQDEILTQSEREREKSVGERVLVCSWVVLMMNWYLFRASLACQQHKSCYST